MTIEDVIENVNTSIDLYKKIIEFDGQSVPAEIMRRRIV